MEVGILPTLNAQLLRLDRSNGSGALATDILNALVDTVLKFEGDRSHENLLAEFLNLYDLLLACRPRMANVILDIQKVILYLKDNQASGPQEIQQFLSELLSQRRTRSLQSIEKAMPIFEKERTLLLHSYSSALNEMLEYAAQHAEKPRVYIAAQEPEKTAKIIKLLKGLEYSFRVVSEYSISHVLNELDCAIFGGLTLNSAEQIVLGPGSSSLISQLSHAEVETYVLLTTNKFSFWEERTETAFKEVRTKSLEEFEYEKDVYSHDMVPLSIISGVISEEAIHSPGETRELFANMQSQFFEREKHIRQIKLNANKATEHA